MAQKVRNLASIFDLSRLEALWLRTEAKRRESNNALGAKMIDLCDNLLRCYEIITMSLVAVFYWNTV